jgi:hypothetical protein
LNFKEKEKTKKARKKSNTKPKIMIKGKGKNPKRRGMQREKKHRPLNTRSFEDKVGLEKLST